MKGLFAAVMALLLSAGVYAQSDERAGDILDKSAAKFKSYKAASVDFVTVMENKEEGIREEHTGVAYMQDGRYRIDLMGVVSFFDGKDLYTYNADAGEITIKNPEDSDDDLFRPDELFEIHNKGFVQKYVGASGGLTQINLIPENPNRSFSKLSVWVSNATGLVSMVVSYGKDGNDVIVDIKSVKETAGFDKSLFEYSQAAYPDAELVDLR